MTGEESLNLGIMYYKGEIVEKNEEKAFELFKKVESLGNKEAYRWMGMCHYFSIETRDNNEKAISYFKKALKFNPQDAEIVWYSAKCYDNEYGYQKAFEYYLKAAELGWKDAFFELSYCYCYGWGTEIDLNKALYWAEKSKYQNLVDLIKAEMRVQK